MAKKGMLIDVTLCVGCGSCVEACRTANGLPKKDKPSTVLDAENYCSLQEREGRNVRRLCMHCENPRASRFAP